MAFVAVDHFVDTVGEEEASVIHVNRSSLSRDVLAVEIDDHAAPPLVKDELGAFEMGCRAIWPASLFQDDRWNASLFRNLGRKGPQGLKLEQAGLVGRPAQDDQVNALILPLRP
jgi:hypothetical protein